MKKKEIISDKSEDIGNYSSYHPKAKISFHFINCRLTIVSKKVLNVILWIFLSKLYLKYRKGRTNFLLSYIYTHKPKKKKT